MTTNRLLLCTMLMAGTLSAARPPIRHVFLIVLENKGFAETFGPGSPAIYLSRILPAQGQLLRQYYGIGHASLPTFDEAEGSDATACCGELPGVNTASPGRSGPGGGRTGALLISQFIQPGTVNDTPYNHYALLRSIEELFALPYLGYAGQPGLQAFGPDVYNRLPPRKRRIVSP